LNLLDRFSSKAQVSNFIKIRLVGAELFHTNGQTVMTKLVAAFRNMANAPSNDGGIDGGDCKNVEMYYVRRNILPPFSRHNDNRRGKN
jgi:hypothetical protein